MTNALTEFVAQERIRLELGPRRLALAVDEGDLGQLALAMRAASSSWGGRRFPILPVDAEGQVSLGSKELLDILETSRVVDFTGRLATQGLVHSGRRRVPVVRARPLDDGSFWTPSAIVSHSLDALGGKRLLEAPSDDPFEVAAVGRLACREEVAEWEEFGAEVVEVSEETHVSSQLARQGVIDATLHGASTHMAAAAFGATIALVYVVGGKQRSMTSTGSGTPEPFDPEMRAWTSLPVHITCSTMAPNWRNMCETPRDPCHRSHS